MKKNEQAYSKKEAKGDGKRTSELPSRVAQW